MIVAEHLGGNKSNIKIKKKNNQYPAFEDESSKKRFENVCKYIINNWEGIVNRYTFEVPGSCTEGQISHVLSERFSRHPMGWGRETLGKLSYLRVCKKNGKKIDKRIFEGEK
ncbi:UPF0236 family transposase-like protein [Peptostreptococcus porci]|uniref:UPF0236 family transposase-like protein n=1 Tax=Peptostreptococcus porci TaxID=2652282 RepID=UPI002A756488|nr:UPF0236 family protein [Peptostreptococcus porci]MDY2795016.1 UPF0236 family protein [Peptostreptococcus porci]